MHPCWSELYVVTSSDMIAARSKSCCRVSGCQPTLKLSANRNNALPYALQHLRKVQEWMDEESGQFTVQCVPLTK